MDATRRITFVVALLVFLVSATVYLITLTPTVPFWDAGEFIAVSNILGVPHPPGTPLYVLMGRVATLIPWRTIAERINAMSAIPSALAVMFTYLCTLKFLRLALRRPESGRPAKAAEQEESAPAIAGVPWAEVLAQVGAVVAGLMLAFSDAFWENSVEAEVYQLMSLGSILVFWLGLRWWEEHDRKPQVRHLLVATYVLWLSVGLHLGVGVMGLPLIVLIALVDWRVAVLFAVPFLAILRVVAGLEKMLGAVLIMSFLTYVVWGFQRKLPGWAVLVSFVGTAIGTYYAFSDANFTLWAAAMCAIAVVLPATIMALGQGGARLEGRVLLLSLFLMVAGYSTHLYLPIRAAQHPGVNEGAPASWDKLRDLLERKQYGEMNMTVRRAPLSVQLDKEFWRYFRRQWPMWNTERLWGAVLPLMLGLLGMGWLAVRQRNSFLYSFVFLGLNTAGLILFLNFSDHEVRDRDYFFQSGYHAYAIFIGIGATVLIRWVAESFSSASQRRIVGWVMALLMIAMPFLVMRTLWFTHDRRGNYVAHDYAYNMLAPLAKDSFVFTNGDNDTFPLWYMQQVENFRKDVRVVNLSLLNTDWYIRQLRDEQPQVPIQLDDRTVDRLGTGVAQDSTGQMMYTSNFMVLHIMAHDKNPDGSWKKQPYFAVTVPEHMGLDKQFTLEGLVYRVNKDTVGVQAMDENATRHALYDVFKYRGLFTATGAWDSTVYKDENASTLSRNYAAAHLQLAFLYRKRGEMARAVNEMERVSRMFPDYTDIMVPLGSFYLEQGDTTRALALFEKLVQRNPADVEARYYYGVLLAYRGSVPEAMRQLDMVIGADPTYGMAYYAAYQTMWDHGDRQRALRYLERWSESNPTDAQAQQVLAQVRSAMGLPQESQMRPVQPQPQLP